MELYLYRTDRQTGPYTDAEARALVASSQIDRTCLAWHEGLLEWLPLEQVVTLPKLPSLPTVIGKGSAIPLGLPPVPPRTIRVEQSVSIKPAGTEQNQVGRWAFFRLPGIKYGLRVIALFAIVIIRMQCQHR